MMLNLILKRKGLANLCNFVTGTVYTQTYKGFLFTKLPLMGLAHRVVFMIMALWCQVKYFHSYKTFHQDKALFLIIDQLSISFMQVSILGSFIFVGLRQFVMLWAFLIRDFPLMRKLSHVTEKKTCSGRIHLK